MIKTRNTVQRDIVLDTVKSLIGTHPTAQQIYEKIAENYPHISRGTVYRNLGILCEMKMLIKVATENGGDRYDYPTHQHAHFECKECHEVYDIDIEPVCFSQNIVSQGFEIQEEAVLLNGLCPNCVLEKEEEMRNERIKGNKNRKKLTRCICG